MTSDPALVKLIRDTIENLPYKNDNDNWGDWKEDSNGDLQFHATSIREFFNNTWQKDHGDTLFENVSIAVAQILEERYVLTPKDV